MKHDQKQPGLAWVLRTALLHRSELDEVELFKAMPFAKRPILWAEQRPLLGGLAMAGLGMRRPIFIDHPMRTRITSIDPAPRAHQRAVRRDHTHAAGTDRPGGLL